MNEAKPSQIQINIAEGVLGVEFKKDNPAKKYTRSGKILSGNIIPIDKGSEAYKTFKNGGFIDPEIAVLAGSWLENKGMLKDYKQLFPETAITPEYKSLFTDDALTKACDVFSTATKIQPLVRIDDKDGSGTYVIYAIYRGGTIFPLIQYFKVNKPTYIFYPGSVGPNDPELMHIYNAVAEQLIKKHHVIDFIEK